MSLVARLRKGKKHTNYTVSIVDRKQSPSSGKSVAIIGYYNPHTKKLVLNINTLLFWISRGAILTNRLDKLLFNKFNLLQIRDNAD